MRHLFLFILITVFLAGCGNSSGSDGKNPDPDTPPSDPPPSEPPPDDESTNLSGVVQKGLFTSLHVNALPVQPGGLGNPISAEIDGQNYSVTVPSGASYVLEATGEFRKDTDGETVQVNLPLTSLVSAQGGAQSANINVFTHLVSERSLTQVEQMGAGLPQAVAASQSFINQALGLPSQTDPAGLRLDQLNGNATLQDPNLQLLLFSGAIVDSLQANQLFAGGFDSVAGHLARAQDQIEAAGILGGFNGINAERLYEDIRRNAGLDLPELEIDDSPIWQCLGNRCLWQPVFVFEPTLSVGSQVIYEADGRAVIDLRLSYGPDIPVEARVYTVDGSAKAGEDYVAIDKIVTFPPGEDHLRITVPVIVDAVDESQEQFLVVVEPVADYLVMGEGTAPVMVKNGAPKQLLREASDDLIIQQVCIDGVGSPETLFRSDCSNSLADVVAIDTESPQVAAVTLDLASTCTNIIDCVRHRDWLVDLVLVASDGVSDQAATPLGRYRYPASAVQPDNQRPRRQNLLLAFNHTYATEAMVDALHNGWDLRLEARIGLKRALVSHQDLPSLAPMPGAIEAGERSVPISGQVQLTSAANSNCTDGHYELTSDFAMAGDSRVSGTACIALDVTPDGAVTATLVQGEIDLLGAIIGLPEGHSMLFGLPGEHPLPVGASELAVAGATLPDGSANSFRLWLHAEGLPFMFQVSGGALTPSGIRIDYATTRYVMSPGFSAKDARPQQRLYSNDIAYRGLEGQAGSLILHPDGIDVQLAVPAGSGGTAFPKGQLGWQGFSQTIAAGKIEAKTSVAIDYQLQQSAACREPGCVAGSGIDYQVTSPAAELDPNGYWLAAATTVNAITPAWGARGNGDFAFARPDDLPQGASLTMALPGYRVANTSRVADYLLAHLQSGGESHQRHPRGSTAASDGNYFPVGLSVGPEIYRGSDDQPSTGGGQPMTGHLQLDNQVDQFNLPDAPAAKYVIRNGGVTGVFNVAGSALEDPLSFYGYDLALDRFALRLRDNELDPFTWIDGNTHVAGDADVRVHFDSLQIDCGARFGEANVIYEACDGSDNNGNTVVDENCGQRLATWRADTEIFSMAFQQQGGQSGGACATGNQRLTLEHQVDLKALDGPVGLAATWTPAGMLEHQDVSLQTRYRLDSLGTAEAPGFPLQSASAEFVAFDADGDRYGTLQFTPSVLSLPFWQALDTDVRVANWLESGTPVPEASVVLPGGTLANLGTSVSHQANLPLQEASIATPGRDLTAQYEWGNTGFGFGLPVYFTPGEISAEEGLSRFVGRRRSLDLFVLEADAGVNYIEPVHTKLSFGASANISKLKSINFQVDLNDPRNLGRVDTVLTDLDLISQPILEPTFGSVQRHIADLNRFAGQGLDDLMRTALEAALEEAGSALGQDPFVLASEALSQIKSAPQQVVTLIDDEVKAPIDAIFNQSEAQLRSELQALEDAILAGNLPTPDLLSKLTAAEQTLVQIRGRIDAATVAIDEPVDGALQILDQINARVADLQNALTEMEALVMEAVTFNQDVCSGDYQGLTSQASGYLDQLVVNLDTGRQLLSTVEGSEVLLPLIDLAASDPAVGQRLRAAQQEISARAEELSGHLGRAEEAILTQVCSNDIEDLVARVEGMIQQLRGQADLLNLDALNSMRYNLEQIKAFKDTLAQQVLEPLDQTETALQTLRTELDNTSDGLTGQALIDQVDSILNQASNGQITALVDESSGADVVDFVFSDVRDELDSSYATVRGRLVSYLDGQLPAAYFTPEQLRQEFVHQLMASAPVADLRETMNQHFAEITRQANELMLDVTDQINHSVKGAIAKVESEINEALTLATAAVRAIPLESAGMDGYAVIAGNQLERAHLAAEWTMSPPAEGQESNSFGAALDAVSWNASNKTSGGGACSLPAGESRIDVTISSSNIPARFAGSDVTLDKVTLGFNLASGTQFALVPKGVYGSVLTVGDISFTEFVIYDPGFTAGIGDIETYIGARAGAVFSEIQAEVAFLAGRTCNQDVLLELDPEVAQFIPLPDTGFFGAYARGAASMPIISTGCPLTVGVGADFGAWVLAGPPLTVGGLVGGGAYGKVACVGSLRGQMKALGQVDTDGNVVFMGEGFGAAGVGSCEPSSWTSRSRSRGDSWCATGDALFRAGYSDGWSIYETSVGAVY